MDVQDVLHSASRGRAQVAKADGRASPPAAQVLLVGAGQRLGESILVALLQDAHIARVVVASVAPLPASLAQLHFTVFADGLPDKRWPVTEVAVLVVGEAGDAALGWRSRYGRDAVFLALAADRVMPLAAALAAAGVKHLVLVEPTQAHLQPGHLSGLAYGAKALCLVQQFDGLTLIRPAREAAAVGERRSLGHRLAAALLQQLRLILPADQTQSDAREVAALVARAVSARHAGVQVFDCAALVAPRKGAAPRPFGQRM